MTHFSVLVVGDVDEQLAPFHEFECTGTEDEFVLDIDETENYRRQFQTATKPMVQLPDGTLKETYDAMFFRESTDEECEEGKLLGSWGSKRLKSGKLISYRSKDWGDGKGYRAKVYELPEGCTEIDVPYTSFIEYVVDEHGLPTTTRSELDLKDKHKYGYILIGDNGVESVINRTNPNKKWDWYVTGGRYSNRLELKDGTYANSAVRRDIKEIPTCYTFLMNREWNTKGKLYMFGMSDDAYTEEQWDAKFKELVTEIPEDALVTVVDCHI